MLGQTAAKAPGGDRSTRDRILDTAADLFYREGARAVGVDLVVERSGVAKTSLYRHFPAKDDLIVAFLQRDNAEFWAQWDRVAKRHPEPAAQLKAQIEWIAGYIRGPKYRGCAFQNIATEFPAGDHPARAVAVLHKTELQGRLASLAKQLGARKPNDLANQLVLLIDGAFISGALLGPRGPAALLLPAALSLIAAADHV